jgi:hypothetical protein
MFRMIVKTRRKKKSKCPRKLVMQYLLLPSSLDRRMARCKGTPKAMKKMKISTTSLMNAC